MVASVTGFEEAGRTNEMYHKQNNWTLKDRKVLSLQRSKDCLLQVFSKVNKSLQFHVSLEII